MRHPKDPYSIGFRPHWIRKRAARQRFLRHIGYLCSGATVLVSIAGCQPFGLRLRDTAKSSITVEPLVPPSLPDDEVPVRAGSRVHPTLAEATDTRKRMERLSGMKRSKDANSKSSVVETNTPDADLDASLAALPPSLQQILARQLAAVDNKSNRSQDTITDSDNAPATESLANVSLAKPQVTDPSSGVSPANAVSQNKPSSSSKSSVRASLSDQSDASEVQLASSSLRDSQPSVQTALGSSLNGAAPSEKQSEGATRPEIAVDSGNWKSNLSEAIEQLKQQLSQSPQLEANVRLQQEATLRLLQLANGNVDDAMEPIQQLDDDEKQFFRKEFLALHEAIQPEGIPIKSRRWGTVLASHRTAADHLASISNLEIKSTAFCTEVEGYGVINKFSKYQFKPDEELLLYCELDNVKADEVKEGFETKLQGSYQIVDRNGVRVADQVLPIMIDTCKNRRRDYFIAYRIYIPMQIAPGSYKLHLSIEDMKANKFGQSTIDFQITK